MMLCKDITQLPEQDTNNIAERKYDGIRANFEHKSGIFKITTRGAVDITARFPDLTSNFPNLDVVLDGELVYLEEGIENMSITQSRVLTSNRFKGELLATQYPITFMIFDILSFQGNSMLAMPLKERKEALGLLSRHLPKNYQIIKFTHDIEALHDQSIEYGWEGIVIKNFNGKYKLDSERTWKKLKNINEVDLTFNKYEMNPKGLKLIKTEQFDGDGIQINLNKKDMHVQCASNYQRIREILDDEGQIKISVRYLNVTSSNRLRMPTFLKIVE